MVQSGNWIGHTNLEMVGLFFPQTKECRWNLIFRYIMWQIIYKRIKKYYFDMYLWILGVKCEAIKLRCVQWWPTELKLYMERLTNFLNLSINGLT